MRIKAEGRKPLSLNFFMEAIVDQKNLFLFHISEFKLNRWADLLHKDQSHELNPLFSLFHFSCKSFHLGYVIACEMSGMTKVKYHQMLDCLIGILEYSPCDGAVALWAMPEPRRLTH